MSGRHLLAVLLDRGIEVVASSRQKPDVRFDGIDFKIWNLTEWKTPQQLDELFAGIEVLFHFGAAVPAGPGELSEMELFDTNVRACLCLGQWAAERRVPLIYLSGAIVYSVSAPTPITEDTPRTAKPDGGFYGLTKVLAEHVLESQVEKGLKLSCLRAPSIYGWGLPGNKMVARLLAQAEAGESIVLQKPVDDKVNLVHAADVAHAALLAAEKAAIGTYNIGGQSMTVHEIAQTCIQVVGKGGLEIAPNEAERPTLNRFDIDSTWACDQLDYAPQVPLSEGLERLVAGRC